MRKLLSLFLMVVYLTGCTGQSNKETIGISAHSTNETVETESSQESKGQEDEKIQPDHNYREYIPIWENGKESNLYDMINDKEIIYIRRFDCPDCEEYEESILHQIKATGVPYMVLECSKNAQEWTDGPAIPSSVVKSIGIEEIPTVVFIMNGTFLTRIENQFSKDGNEIEMVAESAFQ